MINIRFKCIGYHDENEFRRKIQIKFTKKVLNFLKIRFLFEFKSKLAFRIFIKMQKYEIEEVIYSCISNKIL